MESRIVKLQAGDCDARFIAIILDKTTDFTNFIQLAIDMRYVTKELKELLNKHFWTLKMSPEIVADVNYDVIYNITT